jgi:AcrR family transcriptional regulator
MVNEHPELPLSTGLPAWLPARDPQGRRAAGRTLRVQGEDTVRRLLDAGRTAFARHGYSATRVDDVVDAAGTSHGTFYLYFRDKEDLLHRLAIECGDELDRLTAELDALDDPVDEGALREWVTQFVRAYPAHASVIRVWLERRDLDPLMQVLANDTLGGLAEAMQRRLDPDVVTVIDPGVATLALLSLLERLSAYAQSSDGALGEERIAATITEMLAATIRTVSRSPRPARRTRPAR